MQIWNGWYGDDIQLVGLDGEGAQSLKYSCTKILSAPSIIVADDILSFDVITSGVIVKFIIFNK